MVTLKNKVVVITGASSGIGKATAIEFAKKGAKVVLVARRIEKLKELKEHISSFNENCVYVQSDVTREEEVINLFDETERMFGRIDILISNAGRGCEVGLCDLTYDEWLSVIHTNLTSVFLCAREAAKRMISKGIQGHIITVCSILGLFWLPGHAGYCASKHGVTGFNKSIWWELRKHGIKVSTIYPANVDTELFDALKTMPHRREMLAAEDVADYLVAIASKSLLKILAVRAILVFKRIYYFIRYATK
ncbi:MAG: SDR family oxidoreductase [Deltaproteobacteria bacterium]|nr:SDR family oxidoreductase [Deltaproteobacteria bacterium]MCK5422694.1 SDR family oxidoreductase [Deltaproteobacteria bacterium]